MSRVSYKTKYLEMKAKYDSLQDNYNNALKTIEELSNSEDIADDKYNQLLGKYNAKVEDLNIEYFNKYEILKKDYDNAIKTIETLKKDINEKSNTISKLRLELKKEQPSDILKGVTFANGKFWLNGKSYDSVNEILAGGEYENSK